MVDDFKQALARVQNDYGFYVECQTDPEAALARYDLTAEERSALTDPERLAEALSGGLGVNPFRITIKISGKHDWVNRAAVADGGKADAEHDALVGRAVDALRRAATGDERREAAFDLMGLIG
jgi:hypothetical protein